MHPALQRLFEEVEDQRIKMLDSLRQLTPAQLNRAGKNGKWSINQIVSHLVSAERLSVNYIRKKMLGIDQAGDSGLMEEMKMIVLKFSQRLPGLKFRAPRVVIENTIQHDNLEALRKDWESARQDLKVILEKIPDNRIDRLVYRHVRAGRLNIKHALQFMREHVIHHTPQIKKLAKEG